MSGSVNKVILVGNLGRDPEVRTFPSGDKVVSFSMAMTESWRDKATGERKDKTEWVNVSIFNEALGRVAEQYCRKGSKIYLEGQLQTRKWQDQNGQDRYSTEVVLQGFNSTLTMLDGRGEGGGGSEYSRVSDQGGGGGYGGGGQSGGGFGGGSSDLDDEIPF